MRKKKSNQEIAMCLAVPVCVTECPEEGKARLRDTPGLRVTADFLLWTYRKQH